MTERATTITPMQWRRSDDGSQATPKCPNCGRHLGILPGMWRDNNRDAWLCDQCGEFEQVTA